MKSNTITSRILGVTVAALVATLAFSAHAVQQGSARVIKLHGAARYSTGNNVWLPVSLNTVLKPGALVQTASESWVDVLLSGEEDLKPNPVVNNQNSYRPSGDAVQNVVRLRENTLLAIDRLSWERTGADTVTDTQLDLRAGSIFGNVKKSAAASRYEVKLPNGVAGVRGTIYSFSTGILTVYFGSVVVTYINPNNPSETITRVVGAGQQYDLSSDTYRPVPMGGIEDARKQAEGLNQGRVPTVPIIFTPGPIVYISPTIGEGSESAPPSQPVD